MLKLTTFDPHGKSIVVQFSDGSNSRELSAKKSEEVFELFDDAFNDFNHAFNDATGFDAEIKKAQIVVAKHNRWLNVKLRTFHAEANQFGIMEPEQPIFFERGRLNDKETPEQIRYREIMIEKWFALEAEVEKRWASISGNGHKQTKLPFDE